MTKAEEFNTLVVDLITASCKGISAMTEIADARIYLEEFVCTNADLIFRALRTQDMLDNTPETLLHDNARE